MMMKNNRLKAFTLVMLFISLVAMILSAVEKDYVIALCDFILVCTWGYDYWSLVNRK